MPLDDDSDDRLAWVGAPIKVVRILDLKYLDQAELQFEKYITETLAASERAGGRFNPRGEFGAVYTASDVATAWKEIAARFAREGIPGLPSRMGLISIVLGEGRYADLNDSTGRDAWDVERSALIDATPEAYVRCQVLGRAIRVVADFIHAPSSRADGTTMSLFPDRADSTLRMKLQSASREEPPSDLRQIARETW